MFRITVKQIFFWGLLGGVCAQDALSSWQVGNGGDALRLAFAKSKKTASHMTMAVKKQSLSDENDQRVVRWIMANKVALATDILASKHKWTTSEQATCAWTTSAGSAPHIIDFSFPTCRKSVGGFGQAVSLLIHESVHHFGVVNEEFADHIALAIVEAWKSGKTEWLDIKSNLEGSPEPRQRHSAVWTGKEMVVFGGLADNDGLRNLNSGFRFNPDTLEWKALSSASSPKRHGHRALWTGSSMIIWGGFKVTRGRSNWQNSGYIWNSRDDSWSKIASPFGPKETNNFSSARIPQTAVWTGSKLIVWGGLDDSADPVGAVYDVASKKWSRISRVGAPLRRWGHSAVWAEGKMIVWGGVNARKRRTNSGAMYDLEKNTWIPMSRKQAPRKTEAHVAVWNGSSMIVFGGFESRSSLKGEGGIFDPKENTWRKFETESVMARTGHSAVWDGSDLLVFGGKSKRMRTYLNNIALYSPLSNVWKSRQGVNAPSARNNHTAVWTGSSLIIWGGSTKNGTPLGNGGIFYP